MERVGGGITRFSGDGRTDTEEGRTPKKLAPLNEDVDMINNEIANSTQLPQELGWRSHNHYSILQC